jgi:iron complex transport system ATP-binding protein
MLHKLIILTGAIGSGKTTTLMSQLSSIENKYGILTPVISDQRMFQNIRTGESFAMEATPNDVHTIEVGRFVFSQTAFEKAAGIIEDAMQAQNPLVVIDELGSLELKGNGFAKVIEHLIFSTKAIHLLLVVRQNLLPDALHWIALLDNDIQAEVYTIHNLQLANNG